MKIIAESIRTASILYAHESGHVQFTCLVDHKHVMPLFLHVGKLSAAKMEDLKNVLSHVEISEFYYDDGKIITHSPDGVVRVFVNKEA